MLLMKLPLTFLSNSLTSCLLKKTLYVTTHKYELYSMPFSCEVLHKTHFWSILFWLIVIRYTQIFLVMMRDIPPTNLYWHSCFWLLAWRLQNITVCDTLYYYQYVCTLKTLFDCEGPQNILRSKGNYIILATEFKSRRNWTSGNIIKMFL